MSDKRFKKSTIVRKDVASLEADVAFFDARLSLAGDRPASSYQKAQRKVYQTLGEVMSGTLATLRAKPKR